MSTFRIYALVCFAVALFLAVCGDSFAAEVNFIAAVDRNSVPLNGYFRFTIEVSGPISSINQPELPPLDDFNILAGPSESSSYQFINGKISASKSWSWTLQPRIAGELVIGSAVLKYKKEILKTEPVKITVYQSGAPPPSGKPPPKTPSQQAQPERTAPGEPEELFLRAVPSKTTLVQGDAAIVEYKLYFRVNISSYEITSAPRTTGFWSEDFELPRQPLVFTEVIDGRRYQVATIRKIALFPAKNGQLEAGPLEVQCLVKEQRRSRFRDPFDSFFDDPFFSNVYTVPRYVQSQSLKFNVLPFPNSGKPVDFSGAVGKFNLTAELDKDSVQTNDPVTLTVTIQGRGNIKMVPPPKLRIPADFEQYGPETSDAVNKSSGYVTGSKAFKYLLVPRFPGQHKISPISFSYYDPEGKRYITLESPEFTVKAARGRDIIMPGGISISPNEVKLYGSDIRFIKSEGRLRPAGVWLPLRTGYYSMYIVPLILFIGAGIARANHLRRNPEKARARNAFRAARLRIDRAENQDAEKFYRDIAGGLKGFIADKKGISSASLVLEDQKTEIVECGVKPMTMDNLLKIVSECDLGRFAPLTQKGERERLLQRAKNLLKVMESEWKE